MALSVEQVEHRREWRRFLDLPLHLHRGARGWVPPLASLDRWLLDEQLNPDLAHRELRILVARRRGRVEGRIAVHGGQGQATFSHLEARDREAMGAVIEAAREVAREWGATWVEGPTVPGDPSDPGLRVDRQEVIPGVGLPWHPARYVEELGELGAAIMGEAVRWRVPVDVLAGEVRMGGGTPVDVPAAYRTWADDRLSSPAGSVVPDVVAELGATGVRGSWGAARRASRRAWELCAVVRCADDPAVAVPQLAARARAAGYSEIVSPWGGPPGQGLRFVRVRVPA